ncbi:MAG: hypothetical protein IKA36_02940 [Clostridia bacterium]|nr:hypothetical protein [Clostridia bacterium]
MLKTAMKDLIGLYNTLNDLNDHYFDNTFMKFIDTEYYPTFIQESIDRMCIHVNDPDIQEVRYKDVCRVHNALDKIYVVVTNAKYTHVENCLGRFITKNTKDGSDLEIYEPVYVVIVPEYMFSAKITTSESAVYLHDIFMKLLAMDANLSYHPSDRLFDMEEQRIPNYDLMMLLATYGLEGLLISQWYKTDDVPMQLQDAIDTILRIVMNIPQNKIDDIVSSYEGINSLETLRESINTNKLLRMFFD